MKEEMFAYILDCERDAADRDSTQTVEYRHDLSVGVLALLDMLDAVGLLEEYLEYKEEKGNDAE